MRNTHLVVTTNEVREKISTTIGRKKNSSGTADAARVGGSGARPRLLAIIVFDHDSFSIMIRFFF